MKTFSWKQHWDKCSVIFQDRDEVPNPFTEGETKVPNSYANSIAVMWKTAPDGLINNDLCSEKT